MRLLFTLLIALAFAGSAVADQVPETPLLTGPNFQQVPASDILVLPTGGAVTTLGDALATSSGNLTNGTVIPTGATTAQTMAVLSSQQGVLLDAFRQAGDTTDTPAMVRAVAAGVCVLLGSKTYTINNYSMAGTPANFCLKGIPGKSIIQRASATGSTFFQITAATTYIDGVTFDMNSGSVSGTQWGVRWATGGQVISVKNSVFKNNSGTIGSCLVIAGTGAAAGGSFEISSNEVTNCTLQAIYVSSAINGVISKNWVHDVSSFGIFVAGTTSLPAQDVLIDDNRVYRTTSTGISTGGISSPYVFGSPTALRIVVSNNVLQDNSVYGISLECDYCDAIGNTISQSSGAYAMIGGIDTLERYGKIENNTIVFSGINFGIDTGGSLGMLISGNVVTMDQGTAFNVGGNQNTTVRNNIANLTGTAVGVTVYSVEGTGTGGIFPLVSSNTSIENNSFNMTGASTVGAAVYDNAGGSVGATQNSVRNNRFKISTGSSSQAIIWHGGPHSLLIDGNLVNGSAFVFLEPTGSGDVVFDWVHFGGFIQGVSSTTDIRSILPRDLSTYGAGGSVIWVKPTAGGSGYTAATVIVFTGAGCTSQAGTPLISSGAIIGVKMTNFGSGCSGAVTVTATDSGGGSGATFTDGEVPVLPDGVTIGYISASTHTLRSGGGFLSILPAIPIQLITSSEPVMLQAIYGGTFWRVQSYTPPTFAVGSLPTCGSNNSGALVYVTGSTTAMFIARCNGTNWKWTDGTTVTT